MSGDSHVVEIGGRTLLVEADADSIIYELEGDWYGYEARRTWDVGDGRRLLRRGFLLRHHLPLLFPCFLRSPATGNEHRDEA